MKKVKKFGKYEPTISDVLGAVQGGFAHTEGVLTELQTSFARHEEILTHHGKTLKALHEGQDNLKEQVGDIDRRLVNTQNRVEDIADTIESVTRTSAKDKLTILNHERRIQHLERSSK